MWALVIVGEESFRQRDPPKQSPYSKYITGVKKEIRKAKGTVVCIISPLVLKGWGGDRIHICICLYGLKETPDGRI